MKYVISWFPGEYSHFWKIREGTHFTQGGEHLFVKTHEPYRENNIKCTPCKGTWNARNEHGAAVHFCPDNPIVLMHKKSRLIGG